MLDVVKYEEEINRELWKLGRDIHGTQISVPGYRRDLDNPLDTFSWGRWPVVYVMKDGHSLSSGGLDSMLFLFWHKVKYSLFDYPNIEVIFDNGFMCILSSSGGNQETKATSKVVSDPHDKAAYAVADAILKAALLNGLRERGVIDL